MPDPVPPHNLEAEQAVLGALFVAPQCLAEVRPILRSPLAFWRLSHQHIYRAVLAAHDAGESVDWVTAVEFIRRAGALEDCGGQDALQSYLSDITSGVPGGLGAERWAAIVRDRAVRREFILRCSAGRERGLDQTQDTGPAIHDTIRSLTELESLTVSGEPRPLSELVHEARLQRAQVQQWRQNNPGALPGLSSGYGDVDAMTTGWRGGELILVGGRPGEGKSSLLNCFALNIAFAQARADTGRCVLHFSREMTALENTRRMIAARATVDSLRYRMGRLTRDETAQVVEAEGELEQLPLWLEDCFDSPVSEMLAKARRCADRAGLACVFVDYVQIVRPDNDRTERYLQLGQISRGLKRMARQLDVPVVAAVQLGRDVEKGPRRRPRLSDLRESGDLENDADQVWLIYRDDPDDDPSAGGHRVSLICAKNRNGPTGEVPMWFQRATTCFVQQARAFKEVVP